MATNFNAQPAHLEQILAAGHGWLVPSFQRGFSWGEREADDLINDLMVALQEDEANGSAAGDEPQGHFIGTIVVCPAGGTGDKAPAPIAVEFTDGASPQALFLIDGLQRLTTLTILLCVLRDLIASHDAAAADALHALIEGEGDAETSVKLRLAADEHGLMQRAVQARGATLAPADDDADTPAKRALMLVRERFKLALAELTPEEQTAFARWAVKGVQVIVVVAPSIDRAHRIFSALNDRGKPLDRHAIIKSELFARLPRASMPAIDVAWSRVSAMLGADFNAFFALLRTLHGRPSLPIIAAAVAMMEKHGDAQRFFEDLLEPHANAHRAILTSSFEGGAYAGEINALLVGLNRLSGGDWVAPTLLFTVQHREEPAKIAAFLKRLDRLAHALRLLGLGREKRQGRMTALLQAVRNGEAANPEASVWALSREELRNIGFNLRGLYKRGSPLCKIILWRLEEDAAGEILSDRMANFSVEHFLPQRTSSDSPWRTWFPDADEREACAQSLGNLFLVDHKLNDRARNSAFDKKHAIYFEAATDAKVLPLLEPLRTMTAWRPPDVRRRELALTQRINALWALAA
ncbi:MAG: DUF262 domain-containing HNH endonuclease family protein [Pseudomonadota bacterium]